MYRVNYCCNLRSRARFPTDGRTYTNRYNYEDDSDLEVDDEDDIPDNEPASDSEEMFPSSRSSTYRPILMFHLDFTRLPEFG